MSDNESHEEAFDFKVGNSVGQSRSNKNPYFHFVFDEEYDKNIKFSKPANIELDEDEEVIKICLGGNSENDPSHLLSGKRFEDNTEMDDEDTEKNYILIFDESTKTYTLECLDYEFHIGNDFSADVNGVSQKPETSYSDAELELEREIKSQLMQKEMEEDDQPYDFADEEDDRFEEKFREMMEIEGNGIIYEYDDDGDDWMEDDHLEEVDAPSPQAVAEDDMYGPIEDGEDATKDDITGSSNSSSSVSSSSSSDSDNSGDVSDSSELESEFGDIEAQMKQSMNSVPKSPRTQKNSNTAGGNPISLAALLGGGGGAEEQDQDDSSDDSD